MKAFYDQYADGAADQPDLRHVERREMGMMDDSWDPGSMCGTGYGGGWMTGHPRAPGRRAGHTAHADRRRHRLAVEQ